MANVVPSILVTLMMEALSSSETSVLTRATRSNSQKTQFFIVTAMKTSNLTTIHLRITSISAEIRNEYYPNANLE
jgi:hypothetical protein